MDALEEVSDEYAKEIDDVPKSKKIKLPKLKKVT